VVQGRGRWFNLQRFRHLVVRLLYDSVVRVYFYFYFLLYIYRVSQVVCDSVVRAPQVWLCSSCTTSVWYVADYKLNQVTNYYYMHALSQIRTCSLTRMCTFTRMYSLNRMCSPNLPDRRTCMHSTAAAWILLLIWHMAYMYPPPHAFNASSMHNTKFINNWLIHSRLCRGGVQAIG